MAIEKTDSFVGICDNCEDIFDDGEFSIFADSATVKERMKENGWYVGDVDDNYKSKYYCSQCFKFHEEVDDKIILDLSRKSIHSPNKLK